MNINARLLYVPEGMDPPEHIRDAANFVCHRIFVGRNLWFTEDEREGTRYTHLKAAYLFEFVRDYRAALDWLLANNWVETDGKYVIGNKSTGYRWKLNWQAVRRSASDELSVKINKASRKTFRGYTKAHRHLAKWLTRFSVDAAGANRFINGLRRTGEKSVLTCDEYQELCREAVRILDDGEWEHSVCHFGRFHSPYTRLLKELRQFVSYDGQGLVNVDVANSQPLMLGILLIEQGLVSRRIRPDSLSIGSSNASPCASDPQRALWCSLPFMPLSSSPTAYSNSHTITEETSKYDLNDARANTNPLASNVRESDAEHYLQLCENGTIYEHLMEISGYTDRGRFKEQFYERVIYATGKRDYELAKVFREHFPTVWGVIRRSKQQGYQKLPQKMQRAESRVMIDGVCLRLAEEYPDVPVITIHDSIMTTPPHVPTIKRLIAEEFAKIGLNPTLKEEATHDPKAKENEAHAA